MARRAATGEARGRKPPPQAWAAFKVARRTKGLRQKEVAASLNVHLMSVSGWECGKFGVDPYHHKRLSELLGLSLEEISQQCALFSHKNNTHL